MAAPVKNQNVSTTEDVGAGAKARHCAFCLNICGFPVKRCGGCKKRAYCSRECQLKDWSITGSGQRHKNWCGRYECGEEDVDWEVVPIPNKGLGIRAKKLIPTGFRIIVEPANNRPPKIYSEYHDQEPLEASFEYVLNHGRNSSFGFGETCLGPRTSKLNHSCEPNAGNSFDETANVLIIFSQRIIQPGEEICISYCTFARILGSSFMMRSAILSRLGVTCKDDYFCKNYSNQLRVEEGKELYEKMYKGSKGSLEKALKTGEKVLKIQEKLNSSWFIKAEIHYGLFELFVGTSKTLERALDHLRSCLEIRRITAPYSVQQTLRLEELLKHPEKQSSYLLMDKMNEKFPNMYKF